VVLDVRDQWPDLYYEAVPGPLKGLARLMIEPMSREANRALSAATAVWGNAPAAMEWGLNRAGRAATALDRAFPMAYDPVVPERSAAEEAERHWDGIGLGEKGGAIVCYIGMIGHTADLDTALEAARRLGDEARFVFCGQGDHYERLKREASGLSNVWFTGWVDHPKIWTLMNRSAAGLVPYKNSTNFENGITNKPIEYLSAGLPIVTTLRRGALREILDANECGLWYAEGDAEGLAERVRGLAREGKRREEMSRRAKDLFERSFLAERVYGEMIDHLDEVRRSYRGSRSGAGSSFR
jgi:glycosyltransferase involved in cell wall biosynthesis